MYIDFSSPWVLIALVLIGWSVLIALHKRGLLPHNLEVSGPMLLWRTDHGKDAMASIAHTFRPFWRRLGILCIGVATATMIFTAVLMVTQAILIVKYPQLIQETGAREMILLPGLALPVTYGLIALIIAIVVHEFSHGILSEAEDIKIKSLGLAVLAIIPAAFVEPDEEEIKSAPSRSKMKMFSAGPTANILVFMISLLVFTYMLLPFFAPSAEGVGIAEIIEGFPAKEAGMVKGEIITYVDETRVKGIESFHEEMERHRPSEVVSIETNKDVYTIELGSNPDDPIKAFLGVRLFPVTEYYDGLRHPIALIIPQVGAMLPLLGFYAPHDVMLTILQLVFWIGLANFWLGAINLLPAKPFDGGRLMEEYVRAVAKRDVERISNVISALFISLYVGSFLAIVLYGGF